MAALGVQPPKVTMAIDNQTGPLRFSPHPASPREASPPTASCATVRAAGPASDVAPSGRAGSLVDPPGDLDAEMALVGMACVLGPDAPPAIWQVRPADFVDPRHRDLWAIAQGARWRKAVPAMDALFAVASPRYLGALAVAHWPADVAALVAAVRDAAVTRRLIDAANHLAHAWADDDKAKWRQAVADLAREVA